MKRRDVFKSFVAAAFAQPLTVKETLVVPALVYGIVLDESLSMFRQRKATIEGFNNHIKDLQRDGVSLATRLFVTIFSTQISRAALNIPLAEMPELEGRDYVPSGQTALYDAVGYTLAEMERIGGDNTSYVVTVFSDGQENSSREISSSLLATRIQELKATGNWTFSYIGAAGLDLSKEQATLHVTPNNTLLSTRTNAGVRNSYAVQTTALRDIRLQRSMQMGKVATDSLYAGVPDKQEV